jgi:hypothetical protein
MKTLKEYITESFNDKKYMFKIKIAGDVNEDMEGKIKTILEKYKVENFSKNSTTPIQSLPLDFPKLRNTNVNIYDVTLSYPATQYELHEYICNGAKISADAVVVRSPFEPTEQYQLPQEERKGALLDDPDYKELPKIKSEDYHGEKQVQSLLKELAKASKERAKSQGLKIPTSDAVTSKDMGEGNNKSPIAGR